MAITLAKEILASPTTFRNNSNIVSVDTMNIPWENDSMEYSFSNCYNLKGVYNISNDVINLSYTFYNCHSLDTISYIPSDAIYMSGTFYNCSNLINCPKIPSNVSNMSYTFCGCNNLNVTPTIPNSVTNIVGCFADCYSLTHTPTIPENITNLQSTFYNCSNLTSFPTIPNSVSDMTQTYALCKNISGIITYPTNIECLRGTYAYCENITSIPNIPASVTDLYGTFEGCINVSGDIYILSDKVLDCKNMFNGTSQIKNIYIPFNFTNDYAETLYCYSSDYGYDSIYIKCFKNSAQVYYQNGSINDDIKNIQFNESKTEIIVESYSNTSTYSIDTTNNITINHTNGSQSLTLKSFIDAGYDGYGTYDGVYIKDILTSQLPQIPEDVVDINLSDYETRTSNYKTDLIKYIGTNTSVVVPSTGFEG